MLSIHRNLKTIGTSVDEELSDTVSIGEPGPARDGLGSPEAPAITVHDDCDDPVWDPVFTAEEDAEFERTFAESNQMASRG